MARHDKKRTIKFQVLMNEGERDQMNELAHLLELPCAEVVRRCLRNLYRMKVGGIPICASGEGCAIPAVKLAQPTLQVIDPMPSSLDPAPEPLAAL